MTQLIVEPLGDSALLIQFGANVDEAAHAAVQAAASCLERQAFEGFLECVPSFTTLTVYYDLEKLKRSAEHTSAFEFVRCLVEELLKDSRALPADSRQIIEIPVCYGGEHGPDLSYVAEINGLSEEEVIRIHTGQDYLVYALGFAPGFPYLGGVPERISAPRKATPRLHIPAGSVGIAGTQTGIYPLETPGGWQIIGRTPLALFRPGDQPPVLVQSGQMIRFKAISTVDYERMEVDADEH